MKSTDMKPQKGPLKDVVTYTVYMYQVNVQTKNKNLSRFSEECIAYIRRKMLILWLDH